MGQHLHLAQAEDQVEQVGEANGNPKTESVSRQNVLSGPGGLSLLVSMGSALVPICHLEFTSAGGKV